MSRWSAERLRIGLAPDRVEVVRLGARLSRAAPRAQTVPCAGTSTGTDGQPPWQAALDALPAALAGLATRGDAVAVVLSNHFVRYQLLPWQEELSAPAEVEAWARLRLEQTYGAAAAQWTIRTCDDGYGRPQLACAVDGALIDQLGQCLAGLGLRLASLQPLLMAAYNDERRQLKGQTAFAIVEAGRLCLGLLGPGGWREIASRRAGADAAATLEQELATLDAQAEPAQLGVLLVGDDAPWPQAGVPGARLLGAHGAQGRRTLAMCGAG